MTFGLTRMGMIILVRDLPLANVNCREWNVNDRKYRGRLPSIK